MTAVIGPVYVSYDAAMNLDHQLTQLVDRLNAVHSHKDANELRNLLMRTYELWAGVSDVDLAESLDIISGHAAVAATIVRSHTVPSFFK